MLEFAHYGEEREVNATPEELKIAEVITGFLPSSEGSRITRKSSNYITLVIGEWDLARIKYSDKAKWVKLPLVDRGNVKRYIENIDDINAFKDDVIKSYEHILKYS